MILTNESSKTICTLVSLMVTRKPGSRAVIVTDSVRLMEPDYLGGPGRFFELFSKAGAAFTVQRAHCRIKLKIGSVIDFVPLRCETDIDRIRGTEAEMWCVDPRCLFTVQMLNVIRMRDRTGFTLEDLKQLQSAKVEESNH